MLLDENGNASRKHPLHTYLDLINKKLEFVEFCKSANLNVSVVPDSTVYSVTVSLEITNPVYKDCFEYYDIILKKQRKEVDRAKIRYIYDIQESVSYGFQNVSCGTYEISIHPYDIFYRSPFVVTYGEPINMTSNECVGLVLKNELYDQQFDKKVILSAFFVFILLILATGGLILFFYHSRISKSELKNKTKKNEFDDEVLTALVDGECHDMKNKPFLRNIEVYIIHYYDKNEVNKLKIGLLKDFLQTSGYFIRVRTIEEEMTKILFDVDEWLTKMLEKRTDDGNLRKIILIASEEDHEESEYELENLIFSEFVAKVNDNTEQCHRGYDNLFVVLLDNNLNYPERLRKIVRRTRYLLTGDLINSHLISLCLNLCTEFDLSVPDVENNFRELLLRHPVRNLDII